MAFKKDKSRDGANVRLARFWFEIPVWTQFGGETMARGGSICDRRDTEQSRGLKLERSKESHHQPTVFLESILQDPIKYWHLFVFISDAYFPPSAWSVNSWQHRAHGSAAPAANSCRNRDWLETPLLLQVWRWKKMFDFSLPEKQNKKLCMHIPLNKRPSAKNVFTLHHNWCIHRLAIAHVCTSRWSKLWFITAKCLKFPRKTLKANCSSAMQFPCILWQANDQPSQESAHFKPSQGIFLWMVRARKSDQGLWMWRYYRVQQKLHYIVNKILYYLLPWKSWGIHS